MACLLAVVAGCRAAEAPRLPAGDLAVPSASAEESQAEEILGLLWLLGEQNYFAPMVLERARRSERPSVRRALSLALGRLGARAGEEVLLELLRDPDAEVRAAAAFALRVFDTSTVRASLEVAAGDPAPDVGASALRSIGHLLGARGEDEPLAALIGRLALRIGEAEAWSRMARALEGLPPGTRALWAVRVLASGHEAAAARARQHLARSRELGREGLARLAAEDDPFVAGAAMRGLAPYPSTESAALLWSRLASDATHPFVLAAGLEALSAWLERGAEAWTPELEARLLELARHADGAVRLRALEAARHGAHGAAVRAELEERFRDQEAAPGERAAALLSLVAGGAPEARDLFTRALADSSARVRAAAIDAGAALGWEIPSRLQADREPRVRVAWLRTLEDEEALALARRDPAPSVRRWAYEALAAAPGDLEAVVGGRLERYSDIRWASEEDDATVRVTMVHALAALGRARRDERGAVLLQLESFARDDPHGDVRYAAGRHLARFGLEPPPLLGGRPRLFYERIARRTRRPVRLVLTTTAGEVALRLRCPQVPLACAQIVGLAEQGFYDGLEWEVEPGVGLVVGDPSGIGTGDAGFLLRDELDGSPLDRPGLMLLERGLPDMGGSRLLVTLAPWVRPWPDAVVLGEVTAGLETLRGLGAGATVRSIRPDSGGDG